MSTEEEPKDVEIPSQFEIHYLKMSDGAELRCLSYNPEDPTGRVLMYPGMNTLVLSWIAVLEGLSENNYAIDYVESREKHTAKLQKDNIIDRERMLLDCEEAVQLLGLNGTNYITIGSSLGSTTLIHCIARKTIFPRHAILVGPSTHFTYSLSLHLFLPLITHWTYEKIGKPILKKIVLKKYTNEDADPKQKRKYELALELANPVRLKTCLRAWRGNTIFDDLPKINGDQTTCYLIGASEDILHPDEETRAVAESIDKSVFVDLKTNTAAHDQPLIDMILELD